MGSEKNCVKQIQRVSYGKVTLVVSLTQKGLTWEQIEKKKKALIESNSKREKGNRRHGR